MHVFLIRHAHAGSRGGGSRDIYRPLSPKGYDQAFAVADALRFAPLQTIASSPATRCVQTVEPLAAKLGLTVLEDDGLWEDSPVGDAMRMVEAHAAGGLALSSHGNIIPDLLALLADTGTKIKGRGCAKGSVWALDHDADHGFTVAKYFDTDELDDLATNLKSRYASKR